MIVGVDVDFGWMKGPPLIHLLCTKKVGSGDSIV